ncbi:hypothetical protein [Dermatophilus congolensis]|uniref:hypothetical protein n=1 Tax=Dermatophilus congolensis TaxID=1863 RepID=UPI001AB03F61|nr:hypothetical protein [Dermatophilus congolensis]
MADRRTRRFSKTLSKALFILLVLTLAATPMALYHSITLEISSLGSSSFFSFLSTFACILAFIVLWWCIEFAWEVRKDKKSENNKSDIPDLKSGVQGQVKDRSQDQ